MIGRAHLTALGVFSLLAVACAPKGGPSLAPAAPPAAASAPTQSAPAAALQEDTWGKIVAAARKEGRLVVYGSTPFANAGRVITAAFTNRYGIPVDLLILGGRQQVEKLKVERSIRQPIVDVVQTGVTSATEIVTENLAEKAVDGLPALNDKSIFHLDPVYGPQQQIVAFSFTLLGPLVNTRMVAQNEITSWQHILAPKWKGQIIMQDPRGTGVGLNFFSTLTYHKVLDHEYFRRLAQQKPALFAGNDREAYLMTGRGEYAINFAAGQNTVAPIIMEGSPLRILAMDEGNPAQVEPVLMAKGAPHPNAARLFINWLLSVEGQEAYNKTVGAPSLRKDMPDFTPPEVGLKPKKIWNRTWEAAEQSNKDLKAGLPEQIFGKK
ncbi:MAG: extracellular solute-binding protein [Chloroflexi bacterium]|nr:extracellular solute-binding protein [Chloroflexota bacterium]